MRDFLPGYRAYVHASYSESSSLAIIEAMAAGLPIVAGNIGPISELCDDGVEARFWPLDDPAQAAAMLIDLLDCEPARLKAARAASERFRREFDAEVVVPRLLSFLLGTRPAPGGAPPGSQVPSASTHPGGPCIRYAARKLSSRCDITMMDRPTRVVDRSWVIPCRW